MVDFWTRSQALDLCRQIEAIAPDYGCHVALTGGLLYKDGPRKDADILLYRIRQVAEIDELGLFNALASIGVDRAAGFGWCVKATFEGRNIDFFFPEEDGEYPKDEEEIEPLSWFDPTASVGAHPEGGDNLLAPFMGDAAPKADAQSSPSPSNHGA